MVFPIIQVDTTVPPADYCPAVENLALARLSDDSTCIHASWDAFMTHTDGYEVQYGRRNQPYSQWLTLFTFQNFIQFCDLDPLGGYGLRVRPLCNGGKSGGAWAEYYFFQPMNLPVGAESPSDLARHTTASPNPTTGRLEVASDYVILSLDLYDATGRHLMNKSLGSRRTELDLSGYPAGGYLLQVRTPAGITTKHILKTEN